MQTATGEREQFFGRNWTRFLSLIDEQRISQAAASLSKLVGDISGRSFLDIGSGSGLDSLAAIRLGASRVVSFDYDATCVACIVELKRRFAPLADWAVMQGSALDEALIRSLGQFDIVYSWGVLPHTGDLWRSLDLAAIPAKDTIALAIYDDRGHVSKALLAWKKLYSKSPQPIKSLLALATFMATWGKVFIVRPGRSIRKWKAYSQQRGMSPWHDVVDLAGAYPFEVAKAGDVFSFFQQRGFTLERLNTVTRHGLNEFVFRRSR